jgi:hypothetical protein
LNTEGPETQRNTEKGRERGREDTSLIYLWILWSEKFDLIDPAGETEIVWSVRVDMLSWNR